MNRLMAAQKISKASHIVTAWSPWWHKYLSSADFVYVNDSSMRITGLSSMIFYVDMEFLESHSLMEVAVALEFSLQQSLREMDVRARSMKKMYPYADSSLVGLAQSLEINSDIVSKLSTIDAPQWSRLVATKIDRTFVHPSQVEDIPRIPKESWTPEKLGVPDGLTAEKYLKILVDKEREREQEWLDKNDQENNYDDSTDTEENTPNSSTDSDTDVLEGNTQDRYSDGLHGDSVEPEGMSSDESQEHSEKDTQEESLNDPHNEQGTHKEESVGSEDNVSDGTTDESSHIHEDIMPQGDNQHGDDSLSGDSSVPAEDTEESAGEVSHESRGTNDENSSGYTLEDFTEMIDNQDTDSVMAAQQEHHDWEENNLDTSAEKHNDDSERSADNSEDSFDNTNGGVDDSYSDSGDDHGSHDESLSSENNSGDNSSQDSYSSQSSGSYTSLINEIRNHSGDDALNELSTPQLPHDDSIIGLDFNEQDDLRKEIAQDIKEHQLSIPTTGGVSSGDDFIEWAGKKLYKPTVSWRKVLPRMVNAVVSRASMAGTSDMSYSKQNPNQQEGMPLMMGFITYPPEVSILIDASPSMLKYKESAIGEFMELMQSLLMKYSQPVSVAVADSGIKYAISTMNPTSKIMKNIGVTYRGSSADFGSTLERIAKKGINFKGRKMPQPDVLIVFTDCLFHWPLPRSGKLPYSYANIIVVSTREFDEVEEYLPKWVKKNKNFVYINNENKVKS